MTENYARTRGLINKRRAAVAALSAAMMITAIAGASTAQADPNNSISPADLGHAGAACINLKENPTDDTVRMVANRLMNVDGYDENGAAAIMYFATTQICPDMFPVVMHAANIAAQRSRRIT